MTAPTLFFAGGGTGGHVFPLLAVADAVKAVCEEAEIVFIGTERGIEARVVPQRGYTLELTRVAPLRGKGVLGVFRGIFAAAASLPEATCLIDRYSPRAVLSVGGYAAGPVSLMARFAQIPLALIEPNSVMGFSNRLIAPLVDRAYVHYDRVEKQFGPKIAQRVGVPMRPGFHAAPLTALDEGVSILVLGGSLGAKSLNDRVPYALSDVLGVRRILHQAGRGKDAEVRARYRELNVEATVVPFIEDMAGALREAHLVIGRAGAGTVAEVSAVGRPSLLFPYPFAADDHQTVNAEQLAEAGAAVWMPDRSSTSEQIAERVRALLSDGGALCRMAESARAVGRPGAATAVATDLLRLAGLDPSSRGEGSGAGARGELGGGAH